MNHRLSEHRIRATCRELLSGGEPVSGRRLRRELRERFGAVGKTARVFQIWREEARQIVVAPASPVPPEMAEMHRRMSAAEAAAQQHLARAERAELREQAHQDRWAVEIDRLRQELRAQPKYAAEIRALQERVLRLTVELHAVRRAPAPE